MGDRSSESGPMPPADAGDGEAEPDLPGHAPVTRRRLLGPPTVPTRTAPSFPPAGPAPSYQPTEIAAPRPPASPASAAPSYQPTEIAVPRPPAGPPPAAPPYPPADAAPFYQPTEIAAARPPAVPASAAPSSDIMRYGPGVPAVPPSQAGRAAESTWRTGRLPEASRRPARLRRFLGFALTVILLAASGVVLYLRFHHAPFHVTGAAIQEQTKVGCAVDVTGQITTNGSAGTVSYQWVFRPQLQAPQPVSQSVTAGQHALYVTVAVEGQGHGSASQTVTLQVLGPDTEASKPTPVVITCR
jgi:hypothetical protein